MTRVVVLIDGGHVRALAKHAGKPYVPEYIEKVAFASSKDDEKIKRILYYDCRPFNGTVRLPISGQERTYKASADWLSDLAERNLFAVRLGVLKFRGFERRKKTQIGAPTDEDFKVVFEQKGVDMRIGLDIASYSNINFTDRIVLMTGDTDIIPAMKHARKAGLQVVLVEFPNGRNIRALREHADYVRPVEWP
jgi:uncharacterized LabA/DUF88 family protein